MSADDAGHPGSDAANQSKTEAMPPTQGHADPDAAREPTRVETPDLESMNVGAGDPQAPNHDGAAGATAQPSLTGTPAEERSLQDMPGVGYRQPGSLGSTGPDEQIDTDVERSAANTTPAGTTGTDSGPGDAAGVPVVSAYPAEGTSETSGVVQGTRTPQ